MLDPEMCLKADLPPWYTLDCPFSRMLKNRELREVWRKGHHAVRMWSGILGVCRRICSSSSCVLTVFCGLKLDAADTLTTWIPSEWPYQNAAADRRADVLWFVCDSCVSVGNILLPLVSRRNKVDKRRKGVECWLYQSGVLKCIKAEQLTVSISLLKSTENNNFCSCILNEIYFGPIVRKR